MKRNTALLLILAGLAVGGWLPLGRAGRLPTQEPPAISRPEREEARRAATKQEWLKGLLDEDEWSRHARDNSGSLAALLALVQRDYPDDRDIDRIVEMDPLAALDHFLGNPVAEVSTGERIAAAWAYKDPEKAIRHLWSKSGYRADDYLATALTIAYEARPELVGEVLRSKPRRWQEHYLETLFSSTFSVRQPGAPPEVESDDPFADDGYWITRKFGEDLLHCLADDELREKARKFWEGEAPPAKPADPELENPPLDLTRYDPENWGQRDDMFEALRKRPEETVEAIVEQGGYHARKAAILHLMNAFAHDPKSWPAALTELEGWMDRLGVIPDRPPSKFGIGQFLHGPEVAEWIDRQPLALRRAWAGPFVQTWVMSEPAAALDWASSLPEAAARDEAYQSGLIIWTHRDPPAAIAAVEALPPGELRESAISNAAATWATLDRPGAAAWLASLPDSAGKTRALERLQR
jgi:hypothetical protein